MDESSMVTNHVLLDLQVSRSVWLTRIGAGKGLWQSSGSVPFLLSACYRERARS